MTASVSANACEGITVHGNSGVSYCLSKHIMNWYSAYAWCQAQGKKLIDLETACGTLTGKCSELKLSSDEQNKIISNGGNAKTVWTKTPESSSRSYGVILSSGKIWPDLHTDYKYQAHGALCY